MKKRVTIGAIICVLSIAAGFVTMKHLKKERRCRL